MKTMRRFPILLCALIVLMAACGDADKQGEACARRFMQAWPDTAAMHASVDSFKAVREQLRWPWRVSAANRAFSKVLMDTKRDSLVQATFVIVLNADEYAQLKAKPMLDKLLDGRFPTDSAKDYLKLHHWLCQVTGNPDHALALDRMLETIVGSMSEREQMLIYVQASTPAQMGSSLAWDANQPDADTAKIGRQKQLLRTIYSPIDYQTFEQAYNAYHK